jgi:hypothetical protein
MLTSLTISKKLKSVNLALKTKFAYTLSKTKKEFKIIETKRIKNQNEMDIIPAFDVIDEICNKYSFEFFGDKEHRTTAVNLIKMFINEKNEKDANRIVWQWCKYNPIMKEYVGDVPPRKGKMFYGKMED